ncbi:hypothetical protein [Paracoccus sp. (in: a-proteobacteria)]|uniref:hypothetical protein n=1 Tax=Paracoccus sp. TaxID=267 RepID=UPI0026E09CE0|nr:hypothetical protein [Paracoccus sp. (in: a-proteobacteria)]MDO5647189.1 hypothetical protein [Paracoccus sp. (in: a-proteobacteria)]
MGNLTAMFRLLPLFLILIVALTSIGLGAARGVVRAGDQVVICTGSGPVTIRLPGDSHDGGAHICPDMALSLMAAVGVADVAPVVPPVVARGIALPAPVLGHVVSVDVVRARGPPVM